MRNFLVAQIYLQLSYIIILINHYHNERDMPVPGNRETLNQIGNQSVKKKQFQERILAIPIHYYTDQNKMDHYTSLASHYDEYYRYSDAYVNYFTDAIIEGLSIKQNETVVEVGAGTGIFTKEILNPAG